MRLVLILVVIAAVGAWLGWLHFSSSNDSGKPNVTMSVDKGKIEADKDKVVDQVENLGHKPLGKTSAATQSAQD